MLKTSENALLNYSLSPQCLPFCYKIKISATHTGRKTPSIAKESRELPPRCGCENRAELTPESMATVAVISLLLYCLCACCSLEAAQTTQVCK